MANDRQLKANRANSAKSTGPRSTGGKKRAGKNAYRHGLSLSIDLTANAKQVENLARKIAGGSGSKILWDHAINAAQAHLDLARVQRVKIALIERVLARGTVRCRKHLRVGIETRSTCEADFSWQGHFPRTSGSALHHANRGAGAIGRGTAKGASRTAQASSLRASRRPKARPRIERCNQK